MLIINYYMPILALIIGEGWRNIEYCHTKITLFLVTIYLECDIIRLITALCDILSPSLLV